MGWRDFQETPQREFMEFMELMPLKTELIPLTPPLIPFIPLIPIEAESKIIVVSERKEKSPKIETAEFWNLSAKKPDLVSAFCAKYNGHCSVKITGNYPADCIKMNCEYYDLPPVPGKWGVYAMEKYCPAPVDETTQRTTCRSCGGVDYWQSAVQENHTVCRKCHPPAPGAEKVLLVNIAAMPAKEVINHD